VQKVREKGVQGYKEEVLIVMIMVKAKIYITMKPELEYLNSASQKKEDLHRNGFSEVEDVAESKYIELYLRNSKSKKGLEKRVDEMCRVLLANKVYEIYRFEIEN